MFIHSAVAWVVGNLWPLVWTSVLVGVVSFYLGRRWGNPVSYVLLLTTHPHRLAQGWWLCPQCGGSASDQGHACYFCIGAVFDGTPVGFVSRKHLVADWRWRSWTPKPQVHYPTPPTAQRRKVPGGN